jgi:hypothetical protein
MPVINKKHLLPVKALLLISALAILFFTCKQKKAQRNIEQAFYYWKSVLNLTKFEKQRLDSLQINTIYLKFFDVDWDEMAKKPVPVAKLIVNEVSIQSLRATGTNNFRLNIIPVIFITNACIQKIDTGQVVQLGDNISELVFNMISGNSFNNIPEIQFDCDWTASTKDKYFALVKQFKKRFTQTPLSATIRLHQVKFISKTGVPPVDRGLLMCYNMGNLKDPATKNSILETTELKKYTGNLSNYPLPLDVAFPLFNWKVLYRNNMYTGLIQGLPSTAFSNSFCTRTGNRYRILKDTLLQGYDLKKGDMLRDEQSDINEVLAAAKEISKQIKNTRLRVSLYHLDSVILSKYSIHELESIYNSLH